jgi:hypothetical protein
LRNARLDSYVVHVIKHPLAQLADILHSRQPLEMRYGDLAICFQMLVLFLGFGGRPLASNINIFQHGSQAVGCYASAARARGPAHYMAMYFADSTPYEDKGAYLVAEVSLPRSILQHMCCMPTLFTLDISQPAVDDLPGKIVSAFVAEFLDPGKLPCVDESTLAAAGIMRTDLHEPHVQIKIKDHEYTLIDGPITLTVIIRSSLQ